MPPLKILICGGGCAGPALAFWLAQSGHHRIVVVERSPALRATGAQIDLRAQGIQVVQRMGLLDAIRDRSVDEAGVSFVDALGRDQGTILANTSGHGAQSMTSEYEIMRGDLVRILYEATNKYNNVEYMFGKTVDRFEQDDNEVRVHFSDGSLDTYDMLVGADGQGSRIRKAILPSDAPDPYVRTGLHIAYFFVPRAEGDDNIRRTYLSPGGRMVMRRTHNPTETQAYFFLRDNAPEVSDVPRAPLEQQKQFWTERFRGAGWQTDRFVEGIQTTDNFYCQEVVQVRSETWYRGRVVLLGDAVHCPSPMTGMGTTGALVGAYVLAGEISRHGGDLGRAFAGYERTMRPFVREMQKLSMPLVRLAIPDSQWGISVIHWLVWFACLLRIPDILIRFQGEDKGGWKLPEYSELGY